MKTKYALKENEADARRHMQAFWDREDTGRPALNIQYHNPGFKAQPFDYSARPRKAWDLDMDWFAWHASRAMHQTVPLYEAMPFVLTSFGTQLWLIADLMGGDYQWEADTTWLKPDPDVWDRPVPEFDPQHPTVDALTRAVRRMHEIVGDQAFICPPALMDPLTMLAAFRGEEQFMLDLIDTPERVAPFTRAVTTLAIDCHRHFQNLCEELGYGENASWLGAMADGPMDAAQCDTAIMLSPDMFQQFVLPDLTRFVDYFDYAIYHLDGNAQRRHFEHLKTLPKLRGIQWNPDPGQQDPRDWLDMFREIQANDWCLMFLPCYVNTVENACFLARELDSTGLYIALPPFDTREEAEAAAEQIITSAR